LLFAFASREHQAPLVPLRASFLRLDALRTLRIDMQIKGMPVRRKAAENAFSGPRLVEEMESATSTVKVLA
jgi:hypothetical protein